MKKQQSGFTLIELIMVIVVLGILAAFALPRFANLSGDARFAAMRGAFGAVRSASAIVHSAALANPAAVTEKKVTVEQSIDLVGAYAAPTATGIGAAAQISNSDFTVDDKGTTDTYIVADKVNTACKFSYKMAAADSAPTIDDSALTSANCNK